jgi:hypothetical protein
MGSPVEVKLGVRGLLAPAAPKLATGQHLHSPWQRRSTKHQLLALLVSGTWLPGPGWLSQVQQEPTIAQQHTVSASADASTLLQVRMRVLVLLHC